MAQPTDDYVFCIVWHLAFGMVWKVDIYIILYNRCEKKMCMKKNMTSTLLAVLNGIFKVNDMSVISNLRPVLLEVSLIATNFEAPSKRAK